MCCLFSYVYILRNFIFCIDSICRAWDNGNNDSFCDSFDENGKLLDTSSYSKETNITTISIRYLNRAPTFTGFLPIFKEIPEDITKPENIGYSMRELLANISVDLDDEELGTAIIAMDNLLGEWEISSNNQPYNWLPINNLSITDENTVLINSSSRIRLV